jgi:hypothetical protein
MNPFEQLKEQIKSVETEVFGPINSLISQAEEDAQKYYEKGVRSAGNRLKKKMQEIRKAIKHPHIKSNFTSIQNSAKELRQNIVDSAKTESK